MLTLSQISANAAAIDDLCNNGSPGVEIGDLSAVAKIGATTGYLHTKQNANKKIQSRYTAINPYSVSLNQVTGNNYIDLDNYPRNTNFYITLTGFGNFRFENPVEKQTFFVTIKQSAGTLYSTIIGGVYYGDEVEEPNIGNYGLALITFEDINGTISPVVQYTNNLV